MEERSIGLILRIRPLTESSLIVQWLTPDLGRVATVAKGALRPKSLFRGKLDLFYEADFSFQRSRRSQLHNLREVVLRETNRGLRQEIGYVQQASYCAALIEQNTETDTPLPEIFQLMTDLLAHLPNRPPQSLTIFAFEMKLLSSLGLNPDLDATRLSAGTRAILQKLLELDWSGLPRLKPSDSQTHEIRHFLNEFMLLHLGKVPKGRLAVFD